jgi:hypothetical protein
VVGGQAGRDRSSNSQTIAASFHRSHWSTPADSR